MEEKLCRHCNEPKPVTEFYMSTRDGLRAWCKDCQKLVNKSERHKRNQRAVKQRKFIQKPYDVDRVMRWLHLNPRDY